MNYMVYTTGQMSFQLRALIATKLICARGAAISVTVGVRDGSPDLSVDQVSKSYPKTSKSVI